MNGGVKPWGQKASFSHLVSLTLGRYEGHPLFLSLFHIAINPQQLVVAPLKCILHAATLRPTATSLVHGTASCLIWTRELTSELSFQCGSFLLLCCGIMRQPEPPLIDGNHITWFLASNRPVSLINKDTLTAASNLLYQGRQIFSERPHNKYSRLCDLCFIVINLTPHIFKKQPAQNLETVLTLESYM